MLRKLARLAAADAATLAPLEAVGSTRPVRDVFNWDVPFSAESICFYAELADKIGAEVAATDHRYLGMVIAEPYGVIGAIAPWNFPLVMASWKVAPALAAGNAVVLKLAEMTPFAALRLAELAIEAGVPAGIFNVVQGDRRTTGDALVRHLRIGKVTFTGSTRTGAAIIACAEMGTSLSRSNSAERVRRSSLFADAARIDEVARRIAGGIARAFVELQAGPTWAANTTLPPIISEQHAARIDGIVHRSVQGGAVLRCGGTRADAATPGAFYAPTLRSLTSRSTPTPCAAKSSVRC